MSTSTVTAFAGAAIGFAVAGPAGAQWGYLAGSLVGSLVDPQKISGPRLSDLTVQSATEGAPIPLVFGTARIAGNVLQCSAKREHSHTSQPGKGGPKTTTYTYDVDIAIGLCAGPIQGVSRIWANGTLIYDSRPTASASALLASGSIASAIKIYLGTETQLPDPTLEALTGIGKTPAYRGQAYVVFDTLQLEAYGNSIPNFTFEVIQSGLTTPWRRVTAATLPIQFKSSSLPGVGYPQIYSADDIIRVGAVGGATYIIDATGAHLATEPTAPANAAWPPPYAVSGYWGLGKFSDGTAVLVRYGLSTWSASVIYLAIRISAYGILQDVMAALPGRCFICGAIGADGNSLFIGSAATPGEGGNLPYKADQWHVLAWNGTSISVVASGSIPASTLYRNSLQQEGGLGAAMLESDRQTLWRVLTWIDGPVDVYQIGAAGELAHVHEFNGFSSDSGIGPVSDRRYASLYADAGVCVTVVSNAFFVHTRIPALSAQDPTLGNIVSVLCARAGLQPSDIDTSQLTETVTGYVVAQQGTARAAIDPLRQVAPFDVVEDSGTLVFVPRGGAQITVIPWDDLAAHESGDPPDPLVIVSTDETELPTVATVVYTDPAHDYQIASQPSRRNQRTVPGQAWPIAPANNVIRVELPIGLTSAQARRAADVLLWEAYCSRSTVEFAIGLKYASLRVTDPVQIQTPTATYDVRLTRIEEQGSIRKIHAVFEDASLYRSVPPATLTTGIPAQTVALSGPTRAELMDIPLLRDADDGPGYYIALSGYLDGWPGGTLYTSIDSGSTWSLVQTVAHPATIGIAQTILPAWAGNNTVDESSSVTIRVAAGHELSSISLAAMLAGENAALLGDELLQFRTATLIAVNTYTLTGLLRGRRGTESAMAGHSAGDRFVLLSGVAGLARIAGATSDIGQSRQYKPITAGDSLESATSTTWTNTARGLKPLSPVQIGAGRDAGGNVIIQWTRRTRVGGEWRDSVDASLGEASESYVVEILNGLGTTVLRTLTASMPSAVYAYTQQAADFGGQPGTLNLRIYQVSATVGRGTPAAVTLTLPPTADVIGATPPAAMANGLAQQVLIGAVNGKALVSDWGWISSTYTARYHASADAATYSQIGTDSPTPLFSGFHPLFASAGSAWCAWINSDATSGNTLAIYGTDTTKPVQRSTPLLGGTYPVALGSDGTHLVAITWPSPRAFTSTDGAAWTDAGPLGGELAGQMVDSLHRIGAQWLAVVGATVYRSTDPTAASGWVKALAVSDYAYYPDYSLWGGVANGLAIFGSVALEAGGTRTLRIFESTDGVAWTLSLGGGVNATDRRYGQVDAGYLRGPYYVGGKHFFYDTRGGVLWRSPATAWFTGTVSGLPSFTRDGSNGPAPFRFALAGATLACMALTDTGYILTKTTDGSNFAAATAIAYP